jgi:hypothetical protein
MSRTSRTAPSWTVARAALAACALLLLAGCATPAPDRQGDGSTAPDGRDGTAAGSASTTTFTATTTAPASTSARAASCAGTHAHATFAVFVEADGRPRRVDYAAPLSERGEPWYDLGASPTMTVAVHLHQQGPEQGADELGPAQFHYESRGRCPTVQASMAAVETRVEAGGITLHGGHATARQDGTWPGPVRTWLQAAMADPGAPEGCAWAWSELPLQDWLRIAPRDGEALLAAAGDFTPEEVAGMQAQVPAPMTRAPPSCA